MSRTNAVTGQTATSRLATYPATEADVFTLAERGFLHAVLDAADAPAVPARLAEPGVEAAALWTSNLHPELRAVAPYLVKLDLTLMSWIRDVLWDQPWGILIEADLELRDLRRHLRRFLLVEDPTGRALYFRFYDPRVLRTFLPTCNSEELDEFFGPITAYLARGGAPGEFNRYVLGSVAPAAAPRRHPPRAGVKGRVAP
jgi:hypothetical protein